ncbi:Serine/threonine protein kinase and endoribonuclease ERN1/IRE1 [Handroanthus impetiginosus]|uniref:non-specific serine/threonine protein kinase n=1 Tax=Handroanthus impetiginosus TaxID=429701 RepID=A0A2G9HAY6_9LAMI|nr:Serine/threonine protein kinase and endoribonuclease ERN1/IRE1 [Handroanthus impetiginosus]
MRGLYLLIPFMFCLILILVVVVGATPSSNSSDPDPGSGNLPVPVTTNHDTAILAALDGTVYLVDRSSGKIIWSFSSGPSIYSSYQQIPNHEGEKLNASAEGDNFYIDCGEDWELYLHGTGLKTKVKLPLSAEEFVKRTPYISAGGGVMLGTKKTSVFLVDAETGKVIRTFRSDDLPGADKSSNLMRTDIEEWLPAGSAGTEAIEKPLYVTRTDYALKYTSVKTGKVLWYLMFADIEASFQCEGIENFFGGFLNSKFRQEGLGVKLPMHCQTRPVVYRVRDRSSLERLFIDNNNNNRQQDALPGGGILSLPASDHHAIELVDYLLTPHNCNEKEMMLALPMPEHGEVMIRSLPSNDATQISGHLEPDSLKHHFWPSMLYSALVPIAMTCFVCLGGVVFRRRSKLHKQLEDLKLQNVTSKKKKSRKSVVNKRSIVVEKRHVDNEGIKEAETTNGLLLLNPFDNNGISTNGRKIGKLIVANKEIAKGSNGTIVLEGKYDGRSVAVKRLVRTHHNVAVKEIQNLIASDQHPNIVRWYGVEYDQDFVYLCLERCTCSLNELISFCISENEITTLNQDLESPNLLHSNMQLLRALGSNRELELWKSNGYPSACLLKLMRDIVCGLAHLHELGIIHRDLKPQNVLVIKDRLISAKISDMGISKHLDGDMSSLTKHATGSGSSGWQAPEQLRHERQTRAVDLFSLGCILFFCMTGGKHPFGESLERDVNIVNDRKDLFLIDNIPEAADLISRLLDPNPNLRPKAVEVTHHPLFWNSEMRLSFLRDVSDRVELEDREDGSQLLEALESGGKVAMGGKWDEKMDAAFINDIGRYRRYKFDSVRDLLRVIRNKLNHYRELSKEIQAILGPVPEGFDSYFLTRFPKLLIVVYQVIFSHCAEEEIFHKYFRSNRF